MHQDRYWDRRTVRRRRNPSPDSPAASVVPGPHATGTVSCVLAIRGPASAPPCGPAQPKAQVAPEEHDCERQERQDRHPGHERRAARLKGCRPPDRGGPTAIRSFAMARGWLIAAGVVAAVAVAGLLVWLFVLRDTATPVDVEEAVTSFRGETDAS